MLHHRRPAVVEADKAHHTRLTRQLLDVSGLPRAASDRLFAKDMLPGRGDGLHHLLVQKVWRGDVDDMHMGVCDDLMPVGRRLGEAQRSSRFLRPVRHVVGADHKARPDAAVVETVVHQPVRTAVSRTHPAHANYANANLLGHAFFACLL